MRGTLAVNAAREEFWELRETPEQQVRRAALLRLVYAQVSPAGWDARRHELSPERTAAALAAFRGGGA